MSAVYLGTVLFVAALAFVVGWVCCTLVRPQESPERVQSR